MTKPNSTEIIFILDRSGSMESIKSDMIGGFAEFIRQQRAIPGECAVTLTQFDVEYEVVYAGKPIVDVPPLVLAPRGGTALLDAIGRTVQSTGERLAGMREEDRPSKVIVVIITDGEENSSVEYKEGRVHDMIRHQREAYQWDFVFLGADESAITVAKSIGIANAAAYAASAIGVRAVVGSVSSSVGQARMKGVALDYSQEDYDLSEAEEIVKHWKGATHE